MIPNLFPELIKTIIPMGLAAVGFAIAIELLKLQVERKMRERRGETTTERIEKFSSALTEATNLIGSIERELKERHRLVEKLRQDCVRYDQLAKLKSAEVDAVVQSLRGELRQEGKKTFWQSVGLNFLFFIAGIVVTKYLT